MRRLRPRSTRPGLASMMMMDTALPQGRRGLTRRRRSLWCVPLPHHFVLSLQLQLSFMFWKQLSIRLKIVHMKMENWCYFPFVLYLRHFEHVVLHEQVLKSSSFELLPCLLDEKDYFRYL